MYFTQVHEDAIVEYCQPQTTFLRRSELYEDLIQPAFNEMVDKIVFTYRFTTLPNIDELRNDCKVWLTTILAKYDPNRGSKAFSYFSVITKNWFIHQVKKTSKRAKREVEYEKAGKEINDAMQTSNNPIVEGYIEQEFWSHFHHEIESWDSKKMSDNELLVYNAIRQLFASVEELDMLNKKAIYLYLREITGLNTKQIVSQLNKMRKKYRVFKKNWDNGKI
jgi:DNA-directed RNA polymerase specialized sigma24 family protein